MNKFLIIGSLLLFITVIQSKNDPSPPIWADQWQQTFQDYWIIDGQEQTTEGIYYYDAPANQTRLSRRNAQGDGLCSELTTEDEPCTQYIDKGNRFIYFEEQNRCCFSCGAAQGCGILKPGWMADAKFDGVDAIDDDFYNVWETRDGNDPVYTLYNQETGIQAAIYRPGNQQLMIYDQDSYQNYISNPDVFDLPSVCSLDLKCSDFNSQQENIE